MTAAGIFSDRAGIAAIIGGETAGANRARVAGRAVIMRGRRYLTLLFLGCFVLACGVSVALAAQTALAVSRGGDDVVQFDVDSCRVGTHFSVGAFPGSVAVSSSGLRAYVPSLSGSSVSFLDLSANTVTQMLPIDGSPNTMVLLADGRRAYVLDGREGSDGTIIDVVNARVIGPLTVGIHGGNAGGIVLDAAGKNAYVAHPFAETGYISRIDTKTDFRTVFAFMPASTASILLSLDDQRGWVTHAPQAFHEEDPGVLTELSLGEDMGVVRQMPLPRAGAGLTHTGTGLLYVASWGYQRTFVVDPEEQAVVAVIEEAGGTPECRSDSVFCYLADYSRNRVAIVDRRTHSVVGSIAIPSPIRVRLVPRPQTTAQPAGGDGVGPLVPGCCTADANCDGRVTAADLSAIAAATLGLAEPHCGADATCDGEVDTADVGEIARRIFH